MRWLRQALEDATKITNISLFGFCDVITRGMAFGRVYRWFRNSHSMGSNQCAFYYFELKLHLVCFFGRMHYAGLNSQLCAACKHVCYASTATAIHAATDHELCKCKRHSCSGYILLLWNGLARLSISIWAVWANVFTLFHFFFCVSALTFPVALAATGWAPFARRWIVYRTNSWGYLKNGTFDGMIGALVRKEIDVGGSPIFFRLERAKAVDFTARTWVARWVNCKSTQYTYTQNTHTYIHRVNINDRN